MSDVVISPNMNLPVPIVDVDPGPDWANNVNACLGILDQHNHSPGQGVQITTNGININADLALNSNNLTLVNSVRFNNLLSTLSGVAPNLGVIYQATNNLYFNDGVGNVVQLTKAGSVNATSSGISSGTATASFSGGVLVVDANVNTPANVQGASFLFGNNISGSNYLTLQPPNAMGSSYSVTLPPPNSTGTTAFLTYDTSNNIGVLTGNGGITGANIAVGTVAQANLAPRSTGTTVGAGGVAVSLGSGGFSTTSTSAVQVTNMSVTITTTGRPVYVAVQALPTSSGSQIFVAATNLSTLASGRLLIENGGTSVATQVIGISGPVGSNASAQTVAPSSFNGLDMTVNGVPGTYTYNFLAQATASCETGVIDCILIAYEI